MDPKESKSVPPREDDALPKDEEANVDSEQSSEQSVRVPPKQSMPMGDIPDGGLQAWLQVVGGFMLFFNTWGNLNTFGVFQTYYESGVLFHESSSNIAWIGAVQAFLLLFIGGISGPIYDRGYIRSLLVVGSCLIVLGYMMLSLCKEFWQVILAQGFCIGIGGGLLFVPAVSILPTYFRKKLGIAVGISAAGSSMGGVIYPIAFYKLIGEVGFGWSTRIIGFIALVTLLIPISVVKMRVKPPKPRAILDPTAFTDIPFAIFTFSCLLGFVGLYVMFFYLSFFSEQQGITDESMSFYLVPILNAASIVGRTLPNAISDYVGTLNLVGPGALVCGILILCMMAVKSIGSIVVMAILFGFFSGIYIALPPVCFAVLTEDKSKIGTRIGMAFASISVAVLCGGPGGGGILGTDIRDLHWKRLWIYGGVLDLVAGFAFVALRMWRAGWKLKVKV